MGKRKTGVVYILLLESDVVWDPTGNLSFSTTNSGKWISFKMVYQENQVIVQKKTLITDFGINLAEPHPNQEINPGP